MCRRFPRSEAFKIPYAGLATYSVSLTVVDDEGTSSTGTTSAVISGEAVLDLDISTFKVARTGRVGKPLAIELTDGTVLGQAIATVVGVKDGVEVYNWRLNVYDYIGKGDTTFDFPEYTPQSGGTFEWSATIADVDPDLDLATATTVVK